jgi:hypothetical protein
LVFSAKVEPGHGWTFGVGVRLRFIPEKDNANQRPAVAALRAPSIWAVGSKLLCGTLAMVLRLLPAFGLLRFPRTNIAATTRVAGRRVLSFLLKYGNETFREKTVAWHS